MQLAVLLLADCFFYFVVIPTSIVDPENFGLEQGLPPSFSPRLVAALMAGVLLLRAAQLLLRGTAAQADEDPRDGDIEPQAGLPVRALIGMTASLFFATVLIPIAGFFLAGAVLLLVLLWVLGEKRLTRLATLPAIVMLLIWGLFSQLLSLRLPLGMLFMD